ncbi:phosphate ABC transporter permease PstA [Microbacterium sp. C5A9]|jgi:phosphate transport system permease protein|uniref:phosphate ABC transporter permease PstA n=1 Tax=Microbacterium TaxID=33882 RepID=UPI00076A4675|nr:MULTISPECIES: phosphate ABC transporter permease PstA [Microbacterium]PYD00186.1 phosphate ABC transporter permease PtsA [Microbacterium esteraromaticum]AVL95859.1 phosphate ABC transporter permease PtsA [Microbacterium sp. str. 'China']MCI1019703.1 phosphate ABC transporter permease PstA [Microbacterium sp. C5A9]OAN33453.1 phosphate ABC transporter, permease protein PstA [Microbacterium sp. H83]PCE15539.1 phosphate ABC transporter permease [Microbacterium sp. SZ1]
MSPTSTTATQPLRASAPIATGRNGEMRPSALAFLLLLWLSLFVAFAVLITLLITIFLTGQNKLSTALLFNFPSADPDEAGARPAILGSVWAIGATAVMTLPLGIAAAVHLEEFADRKRWFNRFIELNVQNLAAVPSIVYGLLALAFLSMLGVTNKNIVIGGAFALTLLILPVIIIATREALRAVPREIRDGSLALGATQWQTTWRQVLPASVPGIATGSILALSRALGEAAPLLVLGALVYITFDPNGLLSGYTTLPIQIFNWTGRPQEGFHELAGATSILLLAVLILMNALAIFIRNKFQKRW